MSKRLTFLIVALMLAFSPVFQPQAQANAAALLAPAGKSYVRVLHAVPGAGAVDVWVDTTLAITNLAFGDISPYLAIDSGDHDIQVVATGTTTPPIIDAPGVTFASETDYTIAARLDGNAVVPEIFVDDNITPDVGAARVRFVHLSPNVDNVDVAPVGGTPIFTDIAYAVASGYESLPAGTYDLEVRPTGETTVALAVPDVVLKPGTVYTVFALGLLDDTPNLFAKLVADSGYARVRVVHASPDAPGVDVHVDAQKVLTDLTYKEVSPYLLVPAGPHAVSVFATGTITAPVIEANVNLMPGQDYTIAAAGLLASIEPVVYMDDNSAPEAGKAHVRLIHLSPDAPAVDIAVTGGAVLLPDIQFKEASAYLPVDAGTYNLEARAAGSMNVALPVPGVVLTEGSIYTVFAFGLASGTPALEAVPVVDNAAARLRVLHASPDAPNVDVYVDGEKVLTDVAFGVLSEYLTLSAGQHRVQVVPTGTSEVVIDSMPILEAHQDYTAAAVGEVGAPTPSLTALVGTLELMVFQDNNAQPSLAHASVRFIHLSPGAGAVDVAVTGENPVITDIAYLEASLYVEVPAGTYTFDVLETGTDTAVLSVADVVLEPNKVYTIFAIGKVGEVNDLQALLSEDAAYFLMYMPFIPVILIP